MEFDEREYTLNKLTMNKLKFFLYKTNLYIKRIWEKLSIFLLSDDKTYRTDKYEFTTGWSGFTLCYKEAEIDEKAYIQIYFIWGKLFWYLSKKTKPYIRGEYDYDEPKQWGISYYKETPAIYVKWGKYHKFFDMPWSYDWIRTSNLRKDNTWENETKGNRKDFYNQTKWEDILFKEDYDYTYILNNGQTQNVIATIGVTEREWRMKFLKWTKFYNKVHRDIDVSFSSEIGERSGSYKGGVVGKGYIMILGETPLQTLRRMEREYKC